MTSRLYAQSGSEAALEMQSVALELLCRCDDVSDDGVELRVLKGLLTAVTSSVVHVHGPVGGGGGAGG